MTHHIQKILLKSKANLNANRKRSGWQWYFRDNTMPTNYANTLHTKSVCVNMQT